jgi:biopolymer transport protein ExbD
MPLKMHEDEMPSINLTPMVDILFQLIIFFMVGTKFTEMEKKIDLSVPSVATGANLPDVPDKRVVNVYRDGRIELDSQTVSLEQLQSDLANWRVRAGNPSVIVRGDAEGPLQNVASVLTACRDAGISDMGISVRVDRKQR